MVEEGSRGKERGRREGGREERRRAGYRKPQVCAGWWVGGLERGQRKCGTVEE